MRALIVSDIHANLEALEAVLAASSDAYDVLWDLGDVVGYGASPNEVVERMRALTQVHVRGNHDRVCCGLSSGADFNPIAGRAAHWTQSHLTEASTGWLRAMAQGPLMPDGPSVSCVHGSPLNEDEYVVAMRDAWEPLLRARTRITFFGHTHVQGCFAANGSEWSEPKPRFLSKDKAESATLQLDPNTRYLINPGSVGQPRDHDWRTAFAIYDDGQSAAGTNIGSVSATNGNGRCNGNGSTPVNVASDGSDTAPEPVRTVTFHRIPYDIRSAQKRILAAGLPDRLASRLKDGR